MKVRNEKFAGAVLAAFLIFLVGCGGDAVNNRGFTGAQSSTVTGLVVDIDENPVRGATVRSFNRTTTSTASGAFALEDVNDGEVTIRAEVVKNGVVYRGRTVVLNSANTQTSSATITVAPESQLSRVIGTVRDREGFLLTGASVFLHNFAGNSQRVFTDSNGRFEMREVAGGLNYTMAAAGLGYQSDIDTLTIPANRTITVDFVLGLPQLVNVLPPQNISARTWVSPRDVTRSRDHQDAYAGIKQEFDPLYRDHPQAGKEGATRAIRSDIHVHVDMFWDQDVFSNLLGYGIYRGVGSSPSLVSHDFLPEPIAAFYTDLGLNPSTRYEYALTTLATLFNQFPDTAESSLSNVVVAETLAELRLNDLQRSPLTFRWQPGSGAEEYVIFLFEEFPSINESSIWNNASDRATGTAFVYNGPSLIPGETYYYLVLGLANGDSSRTFSQIESFTY